MFRLEVVFAESIGSMCYIEKKRCSWSSAICVINNFIASLVATIKVLTVCGDCYQLTSLPDDDSDLFIGDLIAIVELKYAT